jgi:uncharacterized membrane protein YidH (DUF202 family)
MAAAGPKAEEGRLAGERTRLASERTQLAWWRTGLAALGVALAVGSIVPELAQNSTRWPYTAVGVGFALYAIALVVYGTARARQVDAALSRGIRMQGHDRFLRALAAAGVALAAATAALILLA